MHDSYNLIPFQKFNGKKILKQLYIWYLKKAYYTIYSEMKSVCTGEITFCDEIASDEILLDSKVKVGSFILDTDTSYRTSVFDFG